MNRSIPFFPFAVILCLASISRANGESSAAYRQPLPINTAEAVLEVFWDPKTSDFPQWKVDPDTNQNLQIFQNWAAVDFRWTGNSGDGAALRLSRNIHADCSGYDVLILGMTAPANSTIRLIAETAGGLRTADLPAAGENGEYELPLNGAQRIENLTIEITPRDNSAAAGWFNWIILQNSKQLPIHLDQWKHFDPQWEKLIQPPDFQPAYQPVYGIFINQDDVKTLRDLHGEYNNKQEKSPFDSIAENARSYHPEVAIKQYGKGNARLRDEQAPDFSGLGVKAALAGLVLRDAQLLRVAARYALSLAVCQNWDEGFTVHYPLSSWELRDFKRSYTCEDLGRILDLAGEMFTEAGRDLILRRLAEEGVGPINYGTWRHEYIFDCNQLAFFNTGRMAAYLVLERAFPRVKPYTDIAYRESIENIERAILPDGGYGEGPGYFGSVVRRNSLVIQQYARARGHDGAAAIPEIIQKTGDYAAAVASTTENDHLAICDCDADGLGIDTLLVLASIMPDSYWVTLCRKKLNRATLRDPLEILASRHIPQQGAPLPEFVQLPETGYIASHRKLGEEWVKLFILGNKKNASHCHEDKGSFILEFAGDAYADDIGIGSYGDPLHQLYKQCQRHNMLAPYGGSEIARPQNPLPYDVIPHGQGDAQTFSAQIDAAPGWNGQYKKWIRRWDSPSPDQLIIEDDYELGQGEGVEFYWQTLLPCEVQNQTIIITGQRSRATLQAPDGCEIRVEVLPLQQGKQQNRIAVRKNAQSGRLRISVSLELKP